MTQPNFRKASLAGLTVCAALLATLTGCMTDGSNQRMGYRARPGVHAQATVVFTDDYDYYPGHETYYSRNRKEFVYREGNAWVRRPEPRGIALNALFALPSVRLDFHDAPELHHNRVIRTYPRNWSPPGQRHDNRDERRADKDNDRKADDRRN